MTKAEFQQLSVEYALGSLRGEDLARFERYLQTATPEERAEVSELVETAALIPLTLESKNPPSHVKENLMQQIRLSAQAYDAVQHRQPPAARPPTRFSRTAIWSGVGAAILFVILGVFVANLMRTVQDQHRQLASADNTVRDLAVQITVLKDELAQKEALLNILSSRKIEIAIMNGLKVNPAGYGKVIWDPERQTALLQVSRLPAVPQDKDYQLWVIKDKTPISAGVFAVSDTTAGFFKVDRLSVTNPKEISAFAVTLEPKGGVPAPTGDMYLAGSVKL